MQRVASPSGVMEERRQPQTLSDIWKEADSTKLTCWKCKGSIFDEALVRTFRVNSRQQWVSTTKSSRLIFGPTQHILLFDRHLRCCKSVKYIAVSHVWNNIIGDVNEQGEATPLDIQLGARDGIFSSLKRITDGLISHLDADTEIWYDYISVPQWDPEIKNHVLRSIPHIFEHALFTLVHLHDVSSDTINLLHHGATSQERIDGITGICNTAWFSRVWTAMEFVRSPVTKILVQDGHVIDGVDDVFLGKMHRTWDAERAHFGGDVHRLESAADMGNNIVPWQLGALNAARQAHKVDFGFAFGLLSKRRCRSTTDFFHALLGLVRAYDGGFPDQIPDNPVEAINLIATCCMRAGDYSPLLMNMRSHEKFMQDPPHLFRISGRYDVLACGLFNSAGRPRYHVESTFAPQSSTIKLETIGRVTFATATRQGIGHHMYCFLLSAHLTLHYTGPDARTFVKTMSERLYNVHEDEVQQLLDDADTMGRIQEELDTWYENNTIATWQDESLERAARLADLTKMNKIQQKTHPYTTPLEYMYEHGGTLHNTHPASFIVARCPGCQVDHVYRAGIHGTSAQALGSTAYRITGLSYPDPPYGQPRKDGAGILVKNGMITGRLLWASRACECEVTSLVKVSLKDLPLPIP